MFHPDDKIGPYTLVRELGRGGFGVVWLAERRGTLATTQVALKFPLFADPDLDVITREARLWVQASGHPNVLPVIEAEVYDKQVVIVSEFAPDGSLAAWIKRHGRRAPSIEAAVSMTSEILAGLVHLHGKSIIHRDLKPDNVLLQGNSPRIADFGMARVLKSSEQTLGIAGTPAYMAPEAWEGKRSEQTDLWSVGVMLYEMLAGYRPFPETNRMVLWRAICEAAPKELPSNVSANLLAVVLRSLEKHPNSRYQSADEMLGCLRGGRLPTAPPVSFPAIVFPELHDNSVIDKPQRNPPTNAGLRKELLRKLSRRNPELQREAAAQIIQDGESFVEALVHRLGHSEPDVRNWAAYCLGEIKDQRAILPLLAASRNRPLRRRNEPYSVRAAEAVGKFGPPVLSIAVDYMERERLDGSEIQRLLSVLTPLWNCEGDVIGERLCPLVIKHHSSVLPKLPHTAFLLDKVRSEFSSLVHSIPSSVSRWSSEGDLWGRTRFFIGYIIKHSPEEIIPAIRSHPLYQNDYSYLVNLVHACEDAEGRKAIEMVEEIARKSNIRKKYDWQDSLDVVCKKALEKLIKTLVVPKVSAG